MLPFFSPSQLCHRLIQQAEAFANREGAPATSSLITSLLASACGETATRASLGDDVFEVLEQENGALLAILSSSQLNEDLTAGAKTLAQAQERDCALGQMVLTLLDMGYPIDSNKQLDKTLAIIDQTPFGTPIDPGHLLEETKAPFVSHPFRFNSFLRQTFWKNAEEALLREGIRPFDIACTALAHYMVENQGSLPPRQALDIACTFFLVTAKMPPLLTATPPEKISQISLAPPTARLQ